MIEALTLMKTHGSELCILSDANTVYIETVLKVKNIECGVGNREQQRNMFFSNS